MTDEKKPTKQPFLGTFRELLLDVRFILGFIVIGGAGLLAAGASAYDVLDTRIENRATKVATEKVADTQRQVLDNTAAIRRIETKMNDINEDQKEQKLQTRALREDFRLAQSGRPLPPLPPIDGGSR